MSRVKTAVPSGPWRSDIGIDLIEAPDGLVLCEMNGSNYGLNGFAKATGVTASRERLFRSAYGDDGSIQIASESTIADSSDPRVIKLDVWASWMRRALTGGWYMGRDIETSRAEYPAPSWDDFVARAYKHFGKHPQIPESHDTPVMNLYMWMVDGGFWLFPTPIGDVFDGSNSDRAIYEKYMADPAIRAYHEKVVPSVPLLWKAGQDGFLVPWVEGGVGKSMKCDVLDDLARDKASQKPLHPRVFPFAVHGRGRAKLLASGHEHYVFKPIDGSCGHGVRVVTRRDLQGGVPPGHIAEPLISPRGKHVRVLRCGITLSVDADNILNIYHVASYWRVNPREFDVSDSDSVVTNLSRDAVPHPIEYVEAEEISAWLKVWAEHLRVLWGLPKAVLHANFSLSIRGRYIERRAYG